jgi:4-diphosphocytidyl-2-C-methyl-D-erythritol kinase
VIAFPNCKINLGLHVLNKRTDGFHNLETVFYPLPLQDALEIILPPSPTNDIEFSQSGLAVPGITANNICVKAYRLLRNDFPALPAVKMHLHKTIPMGAGLGGGSADGAFTLTLLAKKFNLPLNEAQLIEYALQLGSDCPFFIKNTACFASGRGEQLEEVKLDLSAYKFVIVNPRIHINTGWAFSLLELSTDHRSIKELIQQPIEKWKDILKNDFEEAVGAHHPQIREIKKEQYSKGAVYASMTGSGSTVFGIFPKDLAPVFSFPADYFVKMV